MRILFISGADQQYGTYHMSKQLLETMCERKYDIHFIVITQKQGPLNEWCNVHNIENYTVPYKYCVYYPTNSRLKKICKHILKWLYVSFSNRLAIRKIRKMGLLSDVNLIHTNINRDLLGEYISKKYKIPNITYLREFSRSHFHLEPLYRDQVQVMNRYSKKFIAISNAVKRDWIEYGLDANKIDVIYDGVDLSKYTLQKKENQCHYGLRLVMCGAIYEGKGQMELIKSICPLINKGLDITLDIYGTNVSENYYKTIIEYIAQHKLAENIRLKGFINNISNVLCNYDIGVVCSKAEGFGLVTVEYMLSGLYVIASDTGANPELLEEGKYGFLYTLGDNDQLSHIIESIYNNKLQLTSPKEIVEYARKEYSIDITVQKLVALYSSATMAL